MSGFSGRLDCPSSGVRYLSHVQVTIWNPEPTQWLPWGHQIQVCIKTNINGYLMDLKSN